MIWERTVVRNWKVVDDKRVDGARGRQGAQRKKWAGIIWERTAATSRCSLPIIGCGYSSRHNPCSFAHSGKCSQRYRLAKSRPTGGESVRVLSNCKPLRIVRRSSHAYLQGACDGNHVRGVFRVALLNSTCRVHVGSPVIQNTRLTSKSGRWIPMKRTAKQKWMTNSLHHVHIT